MERRMRIRRHHIGRQERWVVRRHLHWHRHQHLVAHVGPGSIVGIVIVIVAVIAVVWVVDKSDLLFLPFGGTDEFFDLALGSDPFLSRWLCFGLFGSGFGARNLFVATGSLGLRQLRWSWRRWGFRWVRCSGRGQEEQ